MRVFIIAGKDGIQRYEVTEEDAPLMMRCCELTCEGHNNPSDPENWWVWGEEGTPSDPTLALGEE